MYYSNHAPPHLHARYGDDEVLVQISPLGVLKSKLPPRTLSVVMEWAQIYQEKLMEGWNYAANSKKPQKIPPLQ